MWLDLESPHTMSQNEPVVPSGASCQVFGHSEEESDWYTTTHPGMASLFLICFDDRQNVELQVKDVQEKVSESLLLL